MAILFLGCPYNYFMRALAYYLASLWINNVEEEGALTGEKNKLFLIRLLELKEQHIPQMHNARPIIQYHGRILGPCKAKLCVFFFFSVNNIALGLSCMIA